MGKVIGIDLGTTNSAAAFFEEGHPTIVLTPEGERLLPSMVAFNHAGDRLVGAPAKSQMITNTNTIYSVKRLMGKRFSEAKPYLYQYNYQVVEGEDDTIKIRINDILFSPEEISAMIIEKLKEAAEEYLDDVIEGAIITVPAYFNDSQRQATKDAGEIAGFNVLRIINEPTAASLAFSIDLTKTSTIVVYDFGGGTIDISVLEVQNEVIRVLATAGDINLGGNDFDILLADKVVAEIKQEYRLDLRGDKLALQRIRDAAENAKKELSGVEECEISLPFIADSDEGVIHYSSYITRVEFEDMIKGRVEKTIEICLRALTNAELTVEQVDEVLLVGGSTRIPMVQRKVKDFFRKEPNKKVNPDEIVAMGAAIEGAIVKGESKDILLLDVTPLSLGVKTFGGAFTRVIDANTTIPTSRSLVFSTVEDEQEEVEIKIYQGEREIAEENKFLGKFTLTGIKPATKGVPRIEVTFSININGILKVGAIDLSTRSKNEVLVTHSGLLSDKEIAEIKKSAEKYKQADLKRKQLIEIKNKIFNYIYSIQKILEDPHIDAQLAEQCRDLVKNARVQVEKENAGVLEKIREELADMEGQLAAHESNEGAARARTPRPPVGEPPPPPSPRGGVRKKVPKAPQVQAARSPVSTEGGEGLIVREALKIKKEILRFVYTIEQYLRNVKLDDKISLIAQELVEKALLEVEEEIPRGLGKLHKELSDMCAHLGELAGQTSQTGPTGIDFALDVVPGVPEVPEVPEEPEEFPGDDSVTKDDTKPFIVFE